MDKFWEWMRSWGYGENDKYDGEYVTYHHNKNQSTTIKATPQMLVGYKLEYIRDHATFWEGVGDDLADDQMMINNRLSMMWDCRDIPKELDEIINIIEGT